MFNKTSQRWNQLGGETALATLAEGGYTNWFIKRRGRLPKEVPGAGKGPRGTRKVKKGGSTGKLPEHMTEGKNTVNKPLEILTKKKPRKQEELKRKRQYLAEFLMSPVPVAYLLAELPHLKEGMYQIKI